jgi:hypothetical protein
MALFDELVSADAVSKVVDLGHGQFDRFFAVLQAINFGVEVRRKAIVPMVLFLADADQRTQQSYAMLLDRFPDLPVIPVFNDVVPMVERVRDCFPETARGGAPLDIPAISPVVRGVVDRPNFSFISYLAGASDPTAELYEWTRRMFLLFREIEVRLLLGELGQPRLRHSA